MLLFFRDTDLEGDYQWSGDFTEMFDGLAGRPTWSGQGCTGLKHYDDHPCNHWAAEPQDPWRGSAPRQAPLNQERPQLFHGHAGQPTAEQPRPCGQQGLRQISVPTVVD